MNTCFKRLLLTLSGSGLLLLALLACSKDDNKVATQVAVKVGSEEISVHQINQVLSRTNAAGASPKDVQTLRKEVLEKLIDQQLAVEQAMELKLHRTPEVVAQVEAARREVLARAYLQQLASTLPKPTPEESKKYYTEHPQLFAERRIFSLQEISIPSAAAVATLKESLRALVVAGKPMEDIAAWLKAKEVKFGGGSATRAAEQISLEFLTKIHALKDGQTTILESPQGLTVLRVASSQSAPITEAAALPRIAQFLSNQRGAESIAKTIKELRGKATITYMGDFALASAPVGAPPQPTLSPPELAPPAAKTASGVPATPALAAPISDPNAKTALEKGIAGLK